MDWKHPLSATDAEKEDFAELVVAKYNKEFGFRLVAEQILEPDKPSLIFVERDQQGKLVAGVKLAPLAGSFTANCIGPRMLKEVLGNLPLQEVVEISKSVNVGGLLANSRLLFKTYRWLSEQALYGAVSIGPRKIMDLYRWTLTRSWGKPWDADVHPIHDPQIDVPPDIPISMLWLRPKGIADERDQEKLQSQPASGQAYLLS